MPNPQSTPDSKIETAHTQDLKQSSDDSQARQSVSEISDDIWQFARTYKRPEVGTLGGYRKHVDHLIEETSDDMIAGLKLHLDNLLIFVSRRLSPRMCLT